MPCLSTPNRIHDTPVVRAWLLALCMVGPSAALAQEAANEPAGRVSARNSSGFIPLGSVAGLDVSIGPDQRPRRALRFRFDSATRAMRNLGVEAEDCATVLHSSRHSAGNPGGSSRPGLMVALNCRFF